MEICCFPQSISTYFYKFQSISIILSPYHSYLLIPFLTLLIYSLNGYNFIIVTQNMIKSQDVFFLTYCPSQCNM
ncbi:MAG: hypothetical protein AB1422_10285 [bacterium]